MSKHAKWEADEVLERMTTEFNNAIDELDELHAHEIDAFATFCELVKL